MKTRRGLAAGTAAISLAVIVCLGLLGEFSLRKSQKFSSYPEKTGDPNVATLVEAQREPWVWIHERNQDFVRKTSEFTQKWASNAEGLPGSLPRRSKGPNEDRIIAVGDSFTEGAGDVESLGYPGRLKRLLTARAHSRDFVVMNAGVGGSDPIFGLELLRRKLIRYHPNVVLFAMNSSDIVDIRRRGGLDRFSPEGFMTIRRPWWTPLFDHSHLFRALLMGLLGYDWLLQAPGERARAIPEAASELVRASVEANRLGAENGFKVLTLLQPTWYEIRDRRLPQGLQRVAEGLTATHVDFADLLPDFLSMIPDPITPEYYWPTDAHFTSKGYEVFARSVALEIEKHGLLRR